MRKALLFLILSASLILPSEAGCETALRRGLFVSMLREPTALSSRREISGLIAFAKTTGIKALYVQVYRANLAWFPSKVSDSAPYERCLRNVSEDPLRLLIKQAHRQGLEVHAWLNMLSLGENRDARLLKRYGTDILTRNPKPKRSLTDYKIDDQYFLEPGDSRIREELTEMVGEMLITYPDLDGILFDYVRYPDVKPDYGYSKENVERFRRSTGIKKVEKTSPAWRDWKRGQVTEFLKALVKRTRDLRPSIRIAATGCMPYSRAYHEAFQDWPSWLETGLVDSVTIMNYSASPGEFEDWILTAKRKTADFRRVNIGIGAYKMARSPAVFDQELRLAEKSGAAGCVIFHYNSLVQNPELGDLLSGGNRPKK